MSITNNSAASPLPAQPPTSTQLSSRPLREPIGITGTRTNWAQVESAARRSASGWNSGVTPRDVTSATPESARTSPLAVETRQLASTANAAADKCLNDAIAALIGEDFQAVPRACEEVTKALAPIAEGRVKMSEEALKNEKEFLRRAADTPEKAAKAAESASELAAFRAEEGIAENPMPGLAQFTADACGDRLYHLLPHLRDDQLADLNESLEVFQELAKKKGKNFSKASAPEDLVFRQLLFSVKAELLSRTMEKFKVGSDADNINQLSMDELVDVRDLTTSLNRMVREGTSDNAVLPGARFTWTEITKMGEQAESRLDAMAAPKAAKRRVANASKTLVRGDPAQLKRLKGAVDFLVKTGGESSDASLEQLQKNVIARIKQVEKGKTDVFVTAEMRSTSGAFNAKALSDEQLVGFIKNVVLEDDLTLELEEIKTDVEAEIKDRKEAASAKFMKALRSALDATGTGKSMTALLNSLVVAEKSLAAFKAVNWDFSTEGVADWIGSAVRAPGKRAVPDPGDLKSMASLRDNLTRGEGRIVRDLMAASEVAGSKLAVAYLNLLQHTLDMLLDGNSPPPPSRVLIPASLKPESLSALQTTLNLTVKRFRLVEFQPVVKPVAEGSSKALQKKT